MPPIRRSRLKGFQEDPPLPGRPHPSRKRGVFPEALAWTLAAVYALDRLIKLGAVHGFLQRPGPPAPAQRPGVALLQPITLGAGDLPGALACRAALRYAGHIRHVLICDSGDGETLALCRAWAADHPALDVRIVTVDGVTPSTGRRGRLRSGPAGTCAPTSAYAIST